MSETPRLTLAEFLLARIEEDEATARDAALAARPRGGGWGSEGSPTGERWETRDRRSGMLYVPEIENPADAALWDDEGGCDWMAPARPAGIHIARHDPTRVLAECRAKRGLADLHRPSTDHGKGFDPYCVGCWDAGGMDGAPSYPCPTIRLVALPYAAHPDYNPDWRPAGLESTRPTHPGG